uniref:Uncharacterized protein n=1 Tax=Oryza sativa subsp. japonica TaxID=39947 RepID=Q8H3H6_ORYSJ|nr:hypothetical protein [Oryza sativa Japonica Group]
MARREWRKLPPPLSPLLSLEVPKHKTKTELLTTFQEVAIVDEVTIIEDKASCDSAVGGSDAAGSRPRRPVAAEGGNATADDGDHEEGGGLG